ncbi:IS3 family transposase [Paenibacillus popilliae]|uniref:Transposase and inactivated derivative n=1 Tax=Paenibacillus popilliae ATCC 14706 TaxID=1212764 RepID=M9LRC4_PAEPP|nr:transposase and inactivated derivative [Paenibacillus popilliae ATCC 14706]
MKAKLQERGLTVSRRRIGRIMKEQGLVSTYTVAQYKPHKAACNESQQPNELNRQFQQCGHNSMDSERSIVTINTTNQILEFNLFT